MLPLPRAGGGGSKCVLRLAKVGRGGQGYYLEVAEGTGSGTEPAGRWLGGAARDMGLTGTVSAEPLAAVLEGRDPASGDQLSPAHDRVRVAAFDLTFCAPKSVSLLHALGDADVVAAVRASHDDAVAAVLGYVEHRAAAVRSRSDGARIPRPVQGMVAAEFVHRTSRALDPHLHTHMVVANLAAGPDGRWRALDARGLYAHRAAADALYHAHLRDALGHRLGVGWEPPRSGRADLLGIGLEARQAFSQRSAAIAAEVERVAGRGRRAVDLAAARTRPRRDPSIGADDLTGWWRQRAREVGLGPTAIDRVVDRVPRRSVPRGVPEVSAVVAALGGAPTRRQVVATWCRLAPDGAPVAVAEAGADRVVATVVERAGQPVARWQPGVAEPRLPAGPAIGSERAVAQERAAAQERADTALTRRLADRGMTSGYGRVIGREGPVDLDGPDLGLG